MSSIFPETTGRALEELETMFTDHEGRKYLGTPPWRSIVVKRVLDQELLYKKVELSNTAMHTKSKQKIAARNQASNR